jgi:hypothetical protein
MEAQAPTPQPPDPAQDLPGTAMPRRIASLLRLVHILVGYGRHLAQLTADAAQAAHPRFATIAGACGTHDLALILARAQRGMLRLLALETYLRDRAAKGRDIAIVEPRPRQPVAPPREQAKAKALSAPKKRPAYDMESGYIPTLEELEAEVRRMPVGRVIARTCLDLGIVPGFCTGEVGNAILETMEFFGGSLRALFAVRKKREKAFQRERDKRPDTWGDWDWRDVRKTTVRMVIGWLIGEAPALDPPESLVHQI